MALEKDKLDALRIDNEAWRDSSSTKWIWLALVLAAVAGTLYFFWQRQPEKIQVSTALVRTETSSRQTTVLNASGYVTARRKATVSAKITGKVTEVLIEEGMEVRVGQILARLEDVNLVATLNLAEAQLQAARAALAETEVRIAQAKRDLQRSSNLLDKHVGDEATVDTDRANLEALKARIAAQRSEVAVAERQVALAEQNLDDTIIRAPFSGVVISKDAQPGEMISPVSAGGGFTRTGIGTLVDMGSLEIEVDVNESYINRVSPDQPVEAVLDAYPDWTIPARVLAIVPTADRQRATVRVRIGLDRTDPRILPDMGVKVAFAEPDRDREAASQAPRTVTLIPQKAVRRDGDATVVFVLNRQRAERRSISLGDRRGSDVVVMRGLNAGERVITDGPPDLKDGQELQETSP
ncbi:Efflux RND transporter periplasmic adaptor subunit [Sulfidibacter corallicola]|uniref:Efflux RND transporter periplasmic adaptor subunit n=1 Tax=Sulfidibacter corallicola TaxID=2818388 RepID=A0A8A4TEC9_SULCO|nr:efflux RND transporter periplasmic adaptor subunit [Sulfidibacter corallicola]QTD48316.1 efflux RND transporter periplasmic adaptor subunit [Sulfidibacter corallicola]